MYIPLSKSEYQSMAKANNDAQRPTYSYEELGNQLDEHIDGLPKNVNPVLRDHLNAARELTKAIADNQRQQQ